MVPRTAEAAYTGLNQNGKEDYGDFLFYYNSSTYGYGSFSDFAADKPNLAGYHFLSTGKGKGQYVKNNAAAVRNTEYNYFAYVYFNSNYVGVTDRVEKHQTRNLYNTKNENASFRYAF